jgi:hypothetical protein
MATGLHALLKGNGWEHRRKSLGYVGSIRAVEVTYGENGWHPHAHVLLLFEDAVTSSERADLEEWLYGRWARHCEALDLGTPSRAHGIDLQDVNATHGLGEYLTKVVGGNWGIGNELARSDLKKSGGGRTPWDLLSDFAEDGDADAGRLFQEFMIATKGRHFLVFSRGLKARLAIDEAATDEELAASEGADEFRLRVEVIGSDWNRRVRRGGDGALKVEFEQVGQAVFVLAELLGGSPAVIGTSSKTLDDATSALAVCRGVTDS